MRVVADYARVGYGGRHIYRSRVSGGCKSVFRPVASQVAVDDRRGAFLWLPELFPNYPSSTPTSAAVINVVFAWGAGGGLGQRCRRPTTSTSHRPQYPDSTYTRPGLAFRSATGIDRGKELVEYTEDIRVTGPSGSRWLRSEVTWTPGPMGVGGDFAPMKAAS
ncbi:hypothetical protein VUR80DRAFT_820 [Thermomyces stellatus]